MCRVAIHRDLQRAHKKNVKMGVCRVAIYRDLQRAHKKSINAGAIAALDAMNRVSTGKKNINGLGINIFLPKTKKNRDKIWKNAFQKYNFAGRLIIPHSKIF